MRMAASELPSLLPDELAEWLTEDSASASAILHDHALCPTSSETFDFGSELDSLLASALDAFEGKEEAQATQGSKKNSRRFAPPVSLKEIQQAKLQAVPRSTQRDTDYCVKIWNEWCSSRTTTTGVAIQPLLQLACGELQHLLCCFVLELRKKDGTEYAPDTLHHICCGIMRYLRANGWAELDLFKDAAFAEFRAVLDSEMKRLRAAGIGTVRKQAEPITMDEEDVLWEKGLLGDKNAQTLVDTMLYMNGLYFALRGGREHRNLRYKPSQIQLVEKPGERPYLLYTEDLSKNHPGGLKGRQVKPKCVKHHANIENPKRCFVRLYKLYHSRCPPDRPADGYYLKPLKTPKDNCWYAPIPIGHSSLNTTISRLCKTAGIHGYRTNHSLRATAATRLHQSGMIQEQEIMARTGHRSLEGVRSYKRTSSEQMELVSDVLSNGPKRTCQTPQSQPPVVTAHHPSLNKSVPSTSVSEQQNRSMSLHQAAMNTAPTFNFSSCNSVTIQYLCKQ